MIHKSHSRKDLIEVIEAFELWDIDDYRDIQKAELVKVLWDYLKKCKEICPDDNTLFINDINDLRKYLVKPSPRQVVSVKEKLVILDKVRNIIFYAKHTGYFISGSNYDTIEEIQEDAHYISKFGDMSSVRRALRYYNNDVSNPVKIQPTITRATKARLDKEEQIKKDTMPSFTIKRGKFLVKF
jgi:hypothetical protein